MGGNHGGTGEHALPTFLVGGHNIKCPPYLEVCRKTKCCHTHFDMNSCDISLMATRENKFRSEPLECTRLLGLQGLNPWTPTGYLWWSPVPGRRCKAFTQTDVPTPNNFNRSPPLWATLFYFSHQEDHLKAVESFMFTNKWYHGWSAKRWIRRTQTRHNEKYILIHLLSACSGARVKTPETQRVCIRS